MSWFHSLWLFLSSNSSWMGWNLFLAFIPLFLSLLLFRSGMQQSLWWWLGALVFVAFLPNAPYILTDLIHLGPALQATDSLVFSSLVILPTYLLFVLLGFQAYVLCLINLSYFLKQQGLERWILPIELLLHGLCGIGIYLGRLLRFNSWDLVVHPLQVLHNTIISFVDKQALLFMLVTTGIITLLYAVFKVITLALMAQWKARHLGLIKTDLPAEKPLTTVSHLQD